MNVTLDTILELAKLLDEYSDSSHSQEDLEKIILFCQRVALSCLGSIYRNSRIRSENRDPHSLKAEALSCLGHLFMPSASGRTLLAESWIHIREKADCRKNDKAAMFRLGMLVRTVVRNQKIEDLQQMRPQERRIRKGLKQSINWSNFYRVIRYSGENLIVNAARLPSSFSPVPKDVLRAHCHSVFLSSDSMTKKLEKAMSVLIPEQGDFSPGYTCVDFNELTHIIVEFSAGMLSTHINRPSDHIHSAGRIFLEDICNGVIDCLQVKLEHKYVEKKKMSGDDAEKYLAAMKAYLYDYLEFGGTGSLYSYLEQEMPGLTKKDFSKIHRNRITYFVRELKRVLSEKAAKFLRFI